MNNDKYTFDCRCSFKVLGPPVLSKSKLPALEVDWDNIPLDCKATYDLLATGKTILCFQLEKGAGRQGCKELRPENIEHMAGLGSALRPGASNAVDANGVSTSKHYYRRKNGEEEVTIYHPVLGPILESTYQTVLFQEDQIKIAEQIAGLNKQEADNLRKAIGHKLADEMSKVQKVFIEGAKRVGIVTDAQAAEIFGWIKEAARYSFNKCVSPDTIVETKDGFKILDKVVIGDWINSPYGFVEVLNVFRNDPKKLYEVVLESGKNIKCTIDHKFLCDDNKVHPLWEIIGMDLKIICQGGHARKVTSVIRIGMLPNMDIEVNHYKHLFYGNGITISNSHAVCYGITGYQCAYAKTHFPVPAYTSWLRYAQDRQKPLEEYAILVDDAKSMGVDVYPPSILDLKCYFYTDGEIINYGISNVKNIGVNSAQSIINTIKQLESTFRPLKEWTWYDFLVRAAPEIKKTCMEGLINTGAFRNLRDSPMRCKMLKEYEAISELTVKELEWIRHDIQRFTCIEHALESCARTKKNGGGCHADDRVDKLLSRARLLRNPIIPYRDNPAEIANNEQKYLGISITCSIADSKPGDRWTCVCKDCTGPNMPNVIVLKVKVEEVREITIKRGKEENIGKVMAFLKVSDASCSLSDISCFAEAWEVHKNTLTVGRVVEIQLEKSYKGNRLHVKDVWTL